MVPPLRLQLMIYWTLLMWTTQELTINAEQVNIARLATTSATPHNTYQNNDYKKENAIDGQIDTSSNNIDNCGCCYVSSAASDLHFTATFTGHYHVQQIVIIGRQIGVTQSQQLSDITVYLDDVSVQVETSGTNRATVTPRSASVQTIRITRQQTTRRLLVICEIYVMASAINIASKASLSASPSNGTGYAIANAVDGRVGGNDADTCGCCYLSALSQSPYFIAEFQQSVGITRIVIEGRKDKNDSDSVLNDVTVKLDGSTAVPTKNRTINHLVVIPTSPVQVISIERPKATGTWYLMICELQALVAKCVEGMYGYGCRSTCSPNCANSCESVTGRCIGGCKSGFRGAYCNSSCVPGTFGPNCTADCHCKGDIPCTATSGQCADGCAAGWTGSNCSEACPDGRYGDGCVHRCRCMNYTACDKALGSCPEGCDYGRTGFNCSTNLNLLPRIRDSIHTRMSSVDQYLNTSLAVDGRYDLVSSFDACRCCSLTAGTEKPWWQLDLGRLYLIQDIYVIGRQKDNQQQSTQLISTLSNSTSRDGNLTLTSNQSLGPTVYYYNFDQPRVFQYLIVSKQVRAKMTICEVILIEGVCTEHPGTSFGDKCSRTCHCTDGKTCDRATGKCQSPGCLPGWRGDACDEACPNGSFGDHCSENCHCLNNANCNNVNGTCPNHLCAAGWILYSCSKACSHGSFGDNCSETCHCLNDANCNNVNGNCENHLCAAGWRLDNCSQVCPHGTFGRNCSTECHCLSNAGCDPVSGACPGGLCEPGWQQDSCSQGCDERTFGMNCSSQCHCYNGTSCAKGNGTCLQYTDMCEAGWRSDNCSVVCLHGTFGRNCSTDCHCQSGAECDHVDGECPDGLCEPGWQQDNCSQVCPHGYFGERCSKQCHCFEDDHCDNVEGICDNNMCAPGWRHGNCSQECGHGTFGDQCLKRCNCLNNERCENVNGICQNHRCAAGWRLKSCSQECGHRSFGLDCNATCNCHNGTDCEKANGTCPLGGKCDDGWHGLACSIVCPHGYFGERCSKQCHCFEDDHCDNVEGICDNNMCAPGWRHGNCSQECGHGTFGDQCLKRCNCLNNERCENVNGICQNHRCAAGWRLKSCSQECGHRSFGLDCNATCNCHNGTDCEKANGTCSHGGKCDDGWQGLACSIVCPHGYFGERCSKQCHCLEDDHCDNVEGICDNKMCAPGWRHGNCNQECGHGTFGDQCLKRCNCLNNERCENVNGICQNHRCAAGWRLKSCSQECGHGSFGLDCNATCNCHNGTDCEKSNGTCPLGGKCDDGWHGLACSIAVKQVVGPGGGGSGGSGAAIGGAVAAVVVAIAAVVVFLVWRKRGKRSADKRPQRMRQDDSRSFDAVAESEFNGNKRPAQEQTVEVNKAYEGESSDYYSFTPLTIAEKSITLPKLWHYIRKHQQDSNTLLYEEFATLPYGLHHPVSESQKPANKKKNRYKDMYAYDHSRVVLEVTGPEETDYVNACHVHGHSEPKKFIASQGPMDAMVNDFWRMVWQQNVTRIVMLTNPNEAGAVKCIEYWPETEDKVYGGVRVTYVGSDNFTDYIRRDFTITVRGEERAVSQFHFKSWPDKDVPDNTWCLVGFWRAVNDVSRGQDREAPIVVHCSAGVGRTGTYIALDNLYTQMKAEGVIRPLQTVHSLRQQRVNMVQTKEQYAFLHEAVADALGVATHYVFTSQFPEIYRYLTKADPRSWRTRLEDQFDIVRDIVKECEDPAPVPDIDEVEYANTSHTPEIDAYRPKTRKRSSKHIQEMGAMYLPCFSGANTFLVGKSPSEDSLVEFWSLVQEENVKTVISLCEPSAHNYKTVCTLGTDSSILNGSFVVDMTTECKQKAFTDTTFVYNEEGKDDEDERRTVKVFAYTAWKSGYETPGDALPLLEFVEAVHAWQPHISESQPILIHCGSGTRRSGIICLVMSELARVKREDGQLNILDSLIRLKQRNNGVIHSVEQYRFCHDVILNSVQQQQQQLDSQNIYANV